MAYTSLQQGPGKLHLTQILSFTNQSQCGTRSIYYVHIKSAQALPPSYLIWKILFRKLHFSPNQPCSALETEFGRNPRLLGTWILNPAALGEPGKRGASARAGFHGNMSPRLGSRVTLAALSGLCGSHLCKGPSIYTWRQLSPQGVWSRLTMADSTKS